MDGNKRTAMLTGLTFLELNSINFKAQIGEIEDFAVNIAINHIDVPEISHWLQIHILTNPNK